MTRGEDENDFLKLDSVDFHPFKPSEPAKSIVVKVSGVSNESAFFNFFMWPRVMMLIVR